MNDAKRAELAAKVLDIAVMMHPETQLKIADLIIAEVDAARAGAVEAIKKIIRNYDFEHGYEQRDLIDTIDRALLPPPSATATECKHEYMVGIDTATDKISKGFCVHCGGLQPPPAVKRECEHKWVAMEPDPETGDDQYCSKCSKVD